MEVGQEERWRVPGVTHTFSRVRAVPGSSEDMEPLHLGTATGLPVCIWGEGQTGDPSHTYLGALPPSGGRACPGYPDQNSGGTDCG